MTACANCSHQNPDDARFCNACGAPLDAGDDPARDVRKTVTVLFCDVVGSTELGERHDPEVLRGMMAQFYAAVRAPVERYGGRVEKVIGDALVAVFGLPAVHEDDALRAVRAALEMRDAVRELGGLQARIGVNTGDVLARDTTRLESLVVGDAVNVAARLEQAAGPGEVLVGEATWALIGHAAQGQLLPPIAAKGKQRPLVAWRLQQVDPDAAGQRRQLGLPIVGRESELELLWLAFDRVRQTARPHLVTVLGQAGIGKSRLVAELRRLAGDDVVVLTGNCRAMPGRTSLDPLLEAIAPLRDGEGVGVGAWMADDPEATAVAACLADGGAGARDLAWAATRLIGAVADRAALALVIEDLYWADDLLLDALEQLLERGRRGSLLVVCTARPEFAERRPGWASGANAISLSLEHLDDAHTRDLLAHVHPELGGEQIDRITAAAEGNPLFAEHLAALVGDDGGNGGLPRSIQLLLTARLEALPEPERDVLTAAAIVGREFPLVAVEQLRGRPIGSDLDRLRQRELVETTGAGRAQFGHALLQEAAYALIPKQRRSDLHVQLARWLDDQDAGDAFVADHLQRAVALRSELGQTDADSAALAEEAGARLTAAGRRADALGDPGRARRLLERALQLLAPDSPTRPAAMVELAAAGWNLLPTDQVLALLAEAAELAAARGRRALELRARVLRLGGLPETGPDAVPEAESIAQTTSALRELESLGDSRATATALTELGSNLCARGQTVDGAAYVRRALDLLLAAGDDTVWAFSALVWSQVESATPVAEAEAALAQLLDEQGTRPTVRSELTQGLAMLALLAGRDQEAWRLYDLVGEIERDLGRRTSWRLRQNSPRMLVRGGRYQQAHETLPAIADQLEREGAISNAAVLRTWLALAELRLGNRAAARAAALWVLATPRDDYEATARAHAVLCEVCLADGEVSEGVSHGRLAVDVAERGDWSVLRADARLALAGALAAAGDAAAAAEQAAAAARLSQAKGYAHGAAAAAALLGGSPVPLAEADEPGDAAGTAVIS